MGGSWSKFLLMAGSVDAGMPLMLAVLAISSLLNVYYLLEPCARAFFRPCRRREGVRHSYLRQKDARLLDEHIPESHTSCEGSPR